RRLPDLEEFHGFGAVLVDAYGKHGQGRMLRGQAAQMRQGLAAGRAPTGPEIHHHHSARQGAEADLALAREQPRQGEIGSRGARLGSGPYRGENGSEYQANQDGNALHDLGPGTVFMNCIPMSIHSIRISNSSFSS